MPYYFQLENKYFDKKYFWNWRHDAADIIKFNTEKCAKFCGFFRVILCKTSVSRAGNLGRLNVWDG